MTKQFGISYEELQSLLMQHQLNMHPAQLHGLLCGYICVIRDDDKNSDKILENITPSTELKTVFKKIYELSYSLLHEFSFEFSLLLPEGDEDINIRAESLGLWCQGFLTALVQNNIPIENNASPDIAEVLHDFIEIAQTDFGAIIDNDEEESAYFELVEYVRLSVLMIFNDFDIDVSTEIIN